MGRHWDGGCCVTQRPYGLTGVLGPVTDVRQPVEAGLKEDYQVALFRNGRASCALLVLVGKFRKHI